MSDIIRLNGTVFEHKVGNLLKSLGHRIFSPDWITTINDKLVFIECKDKINNWTGNSKFISKTITGHGLEYYQYANYREILKKFSIRTIFIVCDHDDNCWYMGFLDELDKQKFEVITTKKGSKIIIFDINSFKVIKDEL